TMRRRLAGIVGEQVARDVTISTFHGFCELVLGRYPERFPDHASRRLMGDVEQVLLMREAIETADYGTDQPQLRPPKAPYTYLDDL
ncbi:UvrD-helicase domain-containing protein, partial [Klebsiella pneumoniae]|uniref:UvrD-helicase domain-containing protein n=1 Tax=Klebsiella pneumoniae TaxID=573 RepID=UPI003EE3D916